MEDQSLSIRFVADGMLGTLAKWLRILGYDTLFEPGLDDNQLVRMARAQGRVLLTCDRELARRRGVRHVLLTSQDRAGQLRQVLAEMGLAPDHSFSRCPVCNEPLQPMDLETARERVPPYVAQTQSQFSSCPACRRVYWRGTHWTHMIDYLAQLRPEL
jgi:uncharacterized protein with PIN domain